MLGKRVRPMQRTTSMSQLGGGSRYAERSYRPAAITAVPPSTPVVHDPISCKFLNAGMMVPQTPIKTWQEQAGVLQQEQQSQGNKLAMAGCSAVDAMEGVGGGCKQQSESFAQGGGKMQVEEVWCTGDAPVQDEQDGGRFQVLTKRAPEYGLPAMPLPLLLRHHGMKGSGSEGGGPRSFLDSCFLCRRRLATGRDIFMYRGDIAFCSEECRQYQMINDERREKFSISTSHKGDVSNSITASKPKNEKVGTVAAA